MADLVTHLCSVLIPGVGLRPDRAALLALGSAIPDVGGRTPGIVVELVDRYAISVPEWLPAPFGIIHQPLGGALVAVALAWLLPEEERVRGATLLVAGVAAHLALDVLQDHAGRGYSLLGPFVPTRYELGWIGSEATVTWVPWLVLATLLVWGVRGAVAWWRSRGDADR